MSGIICKTVVTILLTSGRISSPWHSYLQVSDHKPTRLCTVMLYSDWQTKYIIATVSYNGVSFHRKCCQHCHCIYFLRCRIEQLWAHHLTAETEETKWAKMVPSQIWLAKTVISQTQPSRLLELEQLDTDTHKTWLTNKHSDKQWMKKFFSFQF